MYAPPVNQMYPAPAQSYVQQPYYQQQYAVRPRQGKNANGFGITGFILAIIAFFITIPTAGFMWVSAAPAMLAFIFSVVGAALSKSWNMESGLAAAGIAIGSVALLLNFA